MEIYGKIMYGLKFRLYKEDEHVILQLFAYFTGDIPLCEHYKIDLRKGLFLTGKTGVGKTVHMKLVRQFMSYKERFKMKSCQQLALEYMENGSQVLTQYGRNYVDQFDHNTINQTYCFDDIGTEDEVKHYGTQTNALGQIILMRYELFQSRMVLTHFTSNLTAPQIEKHYGERVRSRLREMCNWIEYTVGSTDKRK
ncbi:MAG: ATPase [Saprospiraceae bacterium]|nr:ATPase [Saprospiraceae bacterium]MBK7524569.1 ATPase [Saprospiraceae bacterium]MBK8547753.1 ATPase [Saprospiraceae bacterium]MBK8854893.1 ATPase [Saprospiraceae bacterium]